MPRSAIDIPFRVDYLSILDESGNVDRELEPDIPGDLLLKMHRYMLLTRRLDERMVDLQRQGRIGTFPPVKGHEASHLGAVATLRESDWMVPAFREVGAELWRGRPLENVLLYYAGYDEAGVVEQHRNDLPIAIPVGSQTLHAVGLAYGARYRRLDQVVLCFLGDGATSQGDFHEAMNFAAVFQLPVVFVCQNNQWAISIPRSKQCRAQTLAQKAIGYGMPGLQVDGNDILASYAATQEAVERARSGQGPTFVECITYRVIMHTTADDPKRYRTEEEAALWLKRDPISRFQRYLLDLGLLSDGDVEAVEVEIKAEIQAAVDRAERRMKQGADPLHMFEHTFAELPPTLREQREELRRELAATSEPGSLGESPEMLTRMLSEIAPEQRTRQRGHPRELAAGVEGVSRG